MSISLDPTPMFDLDRYAAVLKRARSMGFEGFGGHCGHAALAINDVLFSGQGQIIGCFNEAFANHDELIGHVVVRIDHPKLGLLCLDADGVPKDFEDVESWGMLAEDEVEHHQRALKLGMVWNDRSASTVATFEMDISDVVQHFGPDHKRLKTLLREAMAAEDLIISADTAPRAVEEKGLRRRTLRT